MRVIYVETSAALAWILGEKRAPEVAKVLDAASRVVSSVLTLVEAHRSFARAEAVGRLSAAAADRLRGVLATRSAEWRLMEVTPAVQARASERFPKEPIRTRDAIHLASALEFVQPYPDLAVLTFDDRILDNLSLLGLASATLEDASTNAPD